LFMDLSWGTIANCGYNKEHRAKYKGKIRSTKQIQMTIFLLVLLMISFLYVGLGILLMCFLGRSSIG